MSRIIKRKHAKDIAILFGLLLVTTIILWYIPTNRNVGFFLFYGPTALWLINIIDNKKNLPHVITAISLYTISYGYIFCILSLANSFWGMPGMIELGFIVGSYDGLLWAWLYGLVIVLAYKVFLDYDRTVKLNKHFIPVIIITFILAIATAIIVSIDVSLLDMNTRFSLLIIWAAVSALPFIFLIFKPKLIKKILLLSVYTFPLALFTEILAIKHEWWTYPGNYAFPVEVFGYITTWEQILFFGTYGSALVILYEITVDDEK